MLTGFLLVVIEISFGRTSVTGSGTVDIYIGESASSAIIAIRFCISAVPSGATIRIASVTGARRSEIGHHQRIRLGSSHRLADQNLKPRT